MVRGLCKLRRHACRLARRHAGWISAVAALAAMSACNISQPRTVLTVGELESARINAPRESRRAIISESVRNCEFYRPLGPRLGMLLIHDAGQWEQLRSAAPELGPCPDLSRGMVVGVTSHAGLPINGDWPIRLDAVRVRDGAGYALAHFEGGSYLPDGTTYVETAQIDGLSAVLIVEINGARFYPE